MLKIVHLASFTGNIGDVANHESFYYNLQKVIQQNIEVTKLEIRDYYRIWNNKSFDSEFVNLVNSHDLFIIGGGNLFELCWDYSATSTTIDISFKQWEQIKTPILVNAIGIDIYKGVTSKNIEKFAKLLGVLKQKQALFTVRNDGSYKVILDYFPEFSDYVIQVYDNGFYFSDVLSSNKLPKKYIGFNVAVDMKEIRYKNINYEEFINKICLTIEYICEKSEFSIIMFPHIYSDYEAIVTIMNKLNNQLVRTRFSIAPLVHSNEIQTFEYYQHCKAIYAMRFHANVCAMALGVPVIPIVNYPKHIEMYDDIGFSHKIIDTNSKDFMKLLTDVTNEVLEDNYSSFILEEEITKQRNFYFSLISEWLNKRNVI